jgi:methyltransferase (TIGR00027 family)
MNPEKPNIKNVSDTAFWVAHYRAIESEKKDALFRDPYARLLTGEHGKRISSSMKSIGRGAYWSVTVRTRLIDDYILKYINQGYKTIINLGAGLDTRPYRLSLPSDIQWIEIDFPAIVDLKNERLKDQEPKCQLERIGLDLSNHAERKKLFDELNQRIAPALVLTEGVIPYLTEASVTELANDIKEQSCFKLWITEYYSPGAYRWYQSEKFKRLLGDSPFQFFPSNWFSFFENHGWTQKEIKYLHDEAKKHKRRFPLPWWVSLLRFILGEKRMMKSLRNFSAYIVFEKT